MISFIHFIASNAHQTRLHSTPSSTPVHSYQGPISIIGLVVERHTMVGSRLFFIQFVSQLQNHQDQAG